MPERPVGGDSLEVEVEVEVAIETLADENIRGASVRFTGAETTLDPLDESRAAERKPFFDQVITQGPRLLRAGEPFVFEARFQVPPTSAPSIRSAALSVTYSHAVEVKLSRLRTYRANFPLKVGVPPKQLEAYPERFASLPRGPKATEINIEVALDSVQLELGGKIRGAVSLQNAQYHAISALELSICGVYLGRRRLIETILVRHPVGWVADPEEGITYSFERTLPKSWTPSFRSRDAEVAWRVEARAISDAGDLISSMPFVLGTPIEALDAPKAGPTLLPLGNARRSELWQEVAQRTGLTYDARRERLQGSRGPISFELRVQLFEVFHLVVRLTWPSLGIGLRVAPVKWLDVVRELKAAGAERFRFKAREPAQLHALLTPEVRAQLARYRRASLDETGAELSKPGNGYDSERLEAFIRTVFETVEVLGKAVEQVPAPKAFQPQVETWRAAAARVNGRLEVGSLSILEGTYRERRVELLHRPGANGALEGPFARVLHSNVVTTPLPTEAQRIADSVARECQAFRITPEAIEATTVGLLTDPARAETLWRALIRVADALAAAA